MRAIAGHEEPAIHALLLDFWPFIDFFPRQVRATFRGAPLAELRRRGLRGLAQIASLTVRYYPHLHTDEFSHDELWLRMGEGFGLRRDQIRSWRTTPEFTGMIDWMRDVAATRPFHEALLSFYAAECVALHVSDFLTEAGFGSPFSEEQANYYLEWVRTHAEAHPDDGTLPHRDMLVAIASHYDPTIRGAEPPAIVSRTFQLMERSITSSVETARLLAARTETVRERRTGARREPRREALVG